MSYFEIPVNFTGASSKADRSISMRFTSQLELSAEQMAKVFAHINDEGMLLFSPDSIQESEIPKDDVKVKGSPSYLLKRAIYINWRSGDREEGFDKYYVDKMNEIIKGLESI